MTAQSEPQTVPSLTGVLVHSYLFLRRAIGVIGIALPIVLVIGALVTGHGLLNSISGSYYSDVRDIYVGSMCAVGVFLLTYRGYDRIDDLASTGAGIAAIGVALFPTTPDSPTSLDRVIGGAHVVFAAVFFLLLAYFCLALFPKSDDPAPGVRKRQRDRVYRVAGIVILACLVLIALADLTGLGTSAVHPVLWLESAATWAFGAAWLTKGEAILRDLPGNAPAAAR